MQITSVDVLKELIKYPSVTPDTTGALDYISSLLSEGNFKTEILEYEGIRNLYAKFGAGKETTLLLGHTDVVPVGEGWSKDPFTPLVEDGYLYGRGAADMKAGVAALVCAALSASKRKQDLSVGVLLTADEEGPAENGVKKAAPELVKRGEVFNYCIVAEPSSSKVLGDTVRVGRRGSLHAEIKFKGKQGHVAFPENAKNPIHSALVPLNEIVNADLASKTPDFPATSFQVSNISAGTGADNVIPGSLRTLCNFRYGTSHSEEGLKALVEEKLQGVPHEVTWRSSAKPFLSQRGKLIKTLRELCKSQLGLTPELSTGGGTSDARFVAPFCPEIAEFGVVNATSHQADERVLLSDVPKLTDVFETLLLSL